MNTYIIYFDWEQNCEIAVTADYFETSKDNEYIIFKTGTQTTGLFRTSEIVGVAKGVRNGSRRKDS